MKLADKTIEVHSRGIESTNQFTIQQSSKMFQILSNSLYNDKIMAAIRELCTNAYDAHIDAKNPDPFSVKLPTYEDPNFCVRDFGTGLSKEDMEKLYTTYGASTKNTSNDFVGCLGLGSKSPFAYTKSFTTTSYFNGVQYTYVAAIDESGVPALNLFHSCPTTEPNGLEISFAVKLSDLNEFSQKAARVLHYFKMKPTIKGGYGINFRDEWSRRNVIFEGTGWKICKLNDNHQVFPSEYHRIDSNIVALMGNIAYPVETDNIIKKPDETPEHIARWNRKLSVSDTTSWENFVSNLLNKGYYIELEFGIGEIEMSVNREGLQYTKAVIKSLRQRTQEIFAELKDMASEKIKSAKTLIEACSMYHSMQGIVEKLALGATWVDPDGKIHNINDVWDIQYSLPDHHLYVMGYRSAGYRSRKMVYLTDSIHADTIKNQAYWGGRAKSNPVKFFLSDIASVQKAKKIAEIYSKQNDCYTYVLINEKDHTKIGEGCDKFIKDVGRDNFLNISDYVHLAVVVRANRNPATKRGSVSDSDVFLILGDKINTTQLTTGYNAAKCMYSLNAGRLEDFSELDDIVYIPITRYAADVGYPSIWALSGNQHNTDIFDTDIYAIKSSSVAKLKKAGLNLIDFNEWFSHKLNAIKSKLEDTIILRNSIKQISEAYSKPSDGRYYASDNLDRKILFSILNIFGIDYANHISNQKIVEALDQLMAYEFLHNASHSNNNYPRKITKFAETDYNAHIITILSKYGANGLNLSDITASVDTIQKLTSIIDSLYSKPYRDDYINAITIKEKNTINLSLASMDTLRKTLKQELDKLPLVKYIVCMASKDAGGNTDLMSLKDNILGEPDRWSQRDKWFDKVDNQDDIRDCLSKCF